MKVLLVAPPRKYWPFINEQDNFLVQQWMVCLGSVIRRAGHEVILIDCMVSKIGWTKLARVFRETAPDVVGAGENHALFSNEVLKCFQLVKQIDPGIRTIAGGAHFSNLARETLQNENVDFVVIGEGEDTFIDLLAHLKEKHHSFQAVPGIAYREDGEIKNTEFRPLIPNLETLPMPAYDLLPMHLYGRSKFLYTPGGTTLFHSRGCTSKCRFCAWWTGMAKRTRIGRDEKIEPCWRTKGHLKIVDEIQMLQKKFNKHFFLFVDPSWNISARFNENFSEEILKRNLNIHFFAFLRVDCLLRDEKNGLFEKMVRAGLCHLCIGAERAENKDLTRFGKNFYGGEQTLQAFEMLNRKYPRIFTQATFIVGIRDETEESFRKQMEFARKLKVDHPAFHPLTPVPGTDLFREAIQKNWLITKNFMEYDWMTPVLKTRFLSPYEIQALIYKAHKRLMTPAWLFRGLTSPYRYKRNMYFWWLIVTLKIFFNAVLRRINPFKETNYTLLVQPSWYEK
jgi:anaerobic magnesium-protoporphyrin IX monomethyl ester cyclase